MGDPILVEDENIEFDWNGD